MLRALKWRFLPTDFLQKWNWPRGCHRAELASEDRVQSWEWKHHLYQIGPELFFFSEVGIRMPSCRMRLRGLQLPRTRRHASRWTSARISNGDDAPGTLCLSHSQELKSGTVDRDQGDVWPFQVERSPDRRTFPSHVNAVELRCALAESPMAGESLLEENVREWTGTCSVIGLARDELGHAARR